MATWHGLAKLRLHTDTTLANNETSSTRLCNVLRKFKTVVCSAYVTQELPSEEAARGRRQLRQAAKGKKKVESEKAAPQASALPVSGKKAMNLRTFNME